MKQSVHYVKLCQIMSLLCQIIFPIIFPIMSNLNYYLTYYVKLFELFFLLFHIIPECHSPVHRSWQTHKLVLCTEKRQTSNEEGQQCCRMMRAACFVKIRQSVQPTQHYYTLYFFYYTHYFTYTHYFFYYTHYFTSLTRIEQQITSTYALQGNVQ